MKIFRLFVFLFFTISLAACNIPSNTDSPTIVPPSQDPILTPSANTVEEADVIFHNGHILTMNKNQPTAEAISIKGETIQAVGSNVKILSLRGPLTKVIDLGGLTLMPGFVDAHTHVFHTFGMANTDAAGAQSLALSYGVTTIGELAGDQSLMLMLRDLGNTGQMRLRVNIYPTVYNEGCQGSVFDQDWYKVYTPGSQIAPNVRMAGIKIYTDGSGCLPPAVSYEYSGGAGHGTLFFETPEKLAVVLKVYYDQGYQIAIHTLGDRAVEQVQQAIATFPTEARDFNHFRTEHNAVVRPDLMKDYTDLGIVGVLFGGYPTCYITNKTDRFAFSTPDDYLNWEWPWKSLIEANPNGHFAYSSDAFGVTSLNPFDHLLGLTTRRELAEDGSICEPPSLLEQNKISIEQALEIMTLGGAYSFNQEDKIGSLEAGKYADLIILSADPLTTKPENFKNTQVYVTLVGGKVEHCAAGHKALCPSSTNTDSEVATTTQGLSQTIKASDQLFESPPTNAIDGNFETIWNSGKNPEQWIMLNLGKLKTVTSIRLHIAQYPEGETTHQIWAGADESSLNLIYEFKGHTVDPSILKFTPDAPLTNIQFIKVITTQSPSWVAWREIEVISP